MPRRRPVNGDHQEAPRGLAHERGWRYRFTLGGDGKLGCCDLFVFVAGNASEQLPLLEADKMKAAYQAKTKLVLHFED